MKKQTSTPLCLDEQKQFSKENYRVLCQTEVLIPIFSRDWWLDAVCSDAWDVCLVEKGGVIVASMPYHLTKTRLGMKVLSHPNLTQTLGPWLRQSGAKYANRLGQEKELLTELIDQLPEFDYFNQNWHHVNTNWLPFYWSGFQQTTRYTYILPDISDLDKVWAGFRENIRGDIRKASNRFKLRVRNDLSMDEFLSLNIQTFARQGMDLPYSNEFLNRIDTACLANNARQIFIAEDEQGRHHAGVYIIWDQNSAYYIMGGGDPELRSSGATSLCMWEAIKFASTVTRSFDFEGSMMEPIERFVRAFGAIQTPYFSISKTTSRYLRIRNLLSGLVQS
ncbi:MAG: GNAT family N-acetyltransferase [Desulfuromonadaceae bacterium]